MDFASRGSGVRVPQIHPGQAHATGLYQRLVARGHPMVRFARQPRPGEAAFLRLTEAQHRLEVTRIVYANDDLPVETVINVFPSQQSRLSSEWVTG
jgi:GntR family transcriptional regulator